MVNTTQWKYGKQWVYSTTYDEVVTSTVQNGLPIHEQFGVPGHLTVVVGQMGEPRDVQGSGYDATYRHISRLPSASSPSATAGRFPTIP